MQRFSFPYPIDPWCITQAWGVPAETYRRFGFGLHNGVDVAHGVDRVIRAPFPGLIVRIGNQPEGGGIFCGLLSTHAFTFDDGRSSQVLADFLHCERLLVNEGQSVIAGQPLAIAGNTGFSTGPHTHIQLRRGSWNGTFFVPADQNDANNSFDPAPYYTGTYVIDDELSRVGKAIAVIAALVHSLTKGRNIS